MGARPEILQRLRQKFISTLNNFDKNLHFKSGMVHGSNLG